MVWITTTKHRALSQLASGPTLQGKPWVLSLTQIATAPVKETVMSACYVMDLMVVRILTPGFPNLVCRLICNLIDRTIIVIVCIEKVSASEM